MSEPSNFLNRRATPENSFTNSSSKLGANGSFIKSDPLKPKRSIARETVTIQSGMSKLRAAIDENKNEKNKNIVVPANKTPSRLPMLKRDSTYVVEASKATVKQNSQNIKPDIRSSPVSNKKESKLHIMSSKNPILKMNAAPKKSPEVRGNTPTDLSSDLQNSNAKTNSSTSSNISSLRQQKRTDVKNSKPNNFVNSFNASDSLEEPAQINKQTPKNLSDFKLQKKMEIQNKPKNNFGSNFALPDVNQANSKSIQTMIENGRKSGQLNLSNQNLDEVPASVWNINLEKFDEKKSSGIAMDTNDNDEYRWWQQAELQKLILASNKIKVISKEIKNLNSIVTLDMHDNQLECIDEAIGELCNLQTLNLSHNLLTKLPNSIKKLNHVKTLNISNNKLNQLPKDFGHLDDLEDLDLSHNCLSSMPKSCGWLLKLRKLNLATNSINTLIPECLYSTNLNIIDVSENQLVKIPEQIGDLSNLEQLFLRQNKIQNLIVLQKCCKLKDWDVSFNKIADIEEDIFNSLVSLVNFNLRDNKLNALPKSMKVLQTLERLDVSNNNLSNLPCELATIESLKQILLTGNPLRAIRKDIVNRGTVAIMKHLRNQLTELAPDEGPATEKDLLRSDIVKSTKVFDLSGKKLTEVTEGMISFCVQTTALALNLSKNLLETLPNELGMLSDQLNEMNLSMNRFTQVPQSLFLLTNLVTLDLRGNQLTNVPYEIRNLRTVRELILADNRLVEISAGVYELPILENLFLNNNRINSLDQFKIIAMKNLSTLNLQNNDLQQIPIELGKATQIRSMPLDGNPFRLPSHRILAKGTPAVLEYLRGRMVES